MKTSRRLARWALVATAAQLAVTNIALAGTCASPSEKAALDVRVLQSELMVAALTCGENARYNAFVEKFHPQLVGFGQALKSYFARAFGTSGEYQMDHFVTRLANDATTRRTQFSMPQYCSNSVNLFNAVLGVDSGALGDYVTQTAFAGGSGIESCPVQASRDASN